MCIVIIGSTETRIATHGVVRPTMPCVARRRRARRNPFCLASNLTSKQRRARLNLRSHKSSLTHWALHALAVLPKGLINELYCLQTATQRLRKACTQPPLSHLLA